MTYKQKTDSNLVKLIKDFKLLDIWRNLNKNKLQYTWKRKNGLEKSRIDFWLIEDSFRPIVISSDIRPAQIKSTYHMAISLKLQLHSIQGAGYWKMNNSFLSDQNYINLIQNVIKGCTLQYENKGISDQTILDQKRNAGWYPV